MKKTHKKKQKQTARVHSGNKSVPVRGIRIELSELQAEALRELYNDRSELVYEEVYGTMKHFLFYVRHSEACLNKLAIEAINIVDFHTSLLKLDLTDVQRSKLEMK